MGAVTPLGLNVTDFWQNILASKSGIGPIRGWDASGQPVRIAAEVLDFNPETVIEKREAKHMDRFTQFAIAAAVEAHADSGLVIDDANRERVGVIIGSGMGGLITIEEQTRVLIARGASRISPFACPMMIPNMAAGQVSIRLGSQGPSSCVVTACASGSNAVGEGMRLIQSGACDAVAAGACEATITPMGLGVFAACRTLSRRNDEPELASRPFDADRDGFVMGEGAAVLILEDLEHAQARGARIYAELAGYGNTSDSYHITAPAPEATQTARCMTMAIRDAGVSPESVVYINAHGTSTDANDRLETLAIRNAFGDWAYKLAVSSTKGATGHMLGAAGAVEAIVTILALRDQTAPPTLNWTNRDPECDLDYVPQTARPIQGDVALSNSFGFGGHNATLLFKRWA